MTIGAFTASTIAMEEDKREEDTKQKRSTIDLAAMTRDVEANVQLAKQGQLHQALEALLNLEKSARLAEDITATKLCCKAILDICFAANDWDLLQEQILVLAKRRSQLKQAVQEFVRQGMTYVDQAPTPKIKADFIKTLQTVTEGKIYVEIERARLTRKLAALKEAEGNVNEAAEVLEEVAVETFGAMAKTEKIAFILEQVRLCLDKKDFIRAHILSKKVSPKAFVERKGEGKGEIGIEGTAIEAADEGTPDLETLKLKYYELMIRYFSHYNNYLEICRCYKAVYESEVVSKDEQRAVEVLKDICWTLVLSPAYSTDAGSSSDYSTLILSTYQDKRLQELPAYKQLLNTFITNEIVMWSTFNQTYGAEIGSRTDIFGSEDSAQRQKDLRLRVTEHNVMVVSKYYKRVRSDRLAELLGLSAQETELHLSELVVSKAVAAKLDRPAGIVTFGKVETPEDVLNSWSGNISKLLSLVEKSCQQIQKELMVHKVQLGAA